ncbi:MAG: rod shape-determining protein MreC [Actinomycetota bacterium]
MYRRSGRHRLALAALLAATATVVTLDFRQGQGQGGPLHWLENAAVSIVAPLQDGIGQVFRPAGDFVSDVANFGSIKDQNEQLRAQIEQLNSQQRRIPEVLRENERLKGLLGIQEADWTQGQMLAARVIANGPSNYEWTSYLNKGSSDGIREGMAVVSAQGLVGRIIFAGGDYSKVLLAIDPQHAVGARLTSSSETGVMSGRGLSDLSFEFIDPEVEIADGETVVTSGYDKGVYPPGIPIGRVNDVREAPDALSQTALVTPVVDFSKLDTVLVLLDSGPIEE